MYYSPSSRFLNGKNGIVIQKPPDLTVSKCIVCVVRGLFLCHFAIAEIKGEPYCDVANASQKCLKIRQKNALSKSAYPCLSLELCVDTTGIFR